MKVIKTFYILLFFIFLFSNFSYSQKYVGVDSIVDNCPKNIINFDKLVEFINKEFSKEDEKARAVFKWVTTNIKYDVVLSETMDYKTINAFSYKTEKEKEIKEKKFKYDLVNNTMISKMAVCHGYAALVESLCLKLGLEAKTILGNLKTDPSQIGELSGLINHAWNVVKIDNNWEFIDATLGAGYISSKTNLFKYYFNQSYFCTNPERFFLNHYPSEEKWLLVSKNKNDFEQLPIFFGTYFENNYQIVKPIEGLYSSLKNQNFIFSIKGLDKNDLIQYSFSDDNEIIYLNQENNLNDFIISITNKKNNYLSIYVNRKIITIYKIL